MIIPQSATYCIPLYIIKKAYRNANHGKMAGYRRWLEKNGLNELLGEDKLSSEEVDYLYCVFAREYSKEVAEEFLQSCSDIERKGEKNATAESDTGWKSPDESI